MAYRTLDNRARTSRLLLQGMTEQDLFRRLIGKAYKNVQNDWSVSNYGGDQQG